MDYSVKRTIEVSKNPINRVAIPNIRLMVLVVRNAVRNSVQIPKSISGIAEKLFPHVVINSNNHMSLIAEIFYNLAAN
jgi:hypothetical protein